MGGNVIESAVSATVNLLLKGGSPFATDGRNDALILRLSIDIRCIRRLFEFVHERYRGECVFSSRKDSIMDPTKSLEDSYTIIATLLHDVQDAHGLVFNTRNLRLTLNKVTARLKSEGMGFLTKTLPRLGKALDRALTGDTKLNQASHGFKTMKGCEYPLFLGELFSQVFRPDGSLLPNPCVKCVQDLRNFLYLFYKYKLPYTPEQELKVLEKFEKTEQELETSDKRLQEIATRLSDINNAHRTRRFTATNVDVITREARILLSELFASFDPLDIRPRHGPGAVATKQRLWNKYLWRNVSARITQTYPFDAFFKASIGHVCDTYETDNSLTQDDLPARVILVPKDSRGPRLISCEPVDFQWVQQGLGRAIVHHVERHRSTRFNVFFTDQQPNQRGALLGSSRFKRSDCSKELSVGRYSTLDLNEASDRVSVELVRLLFPPHIYEYLEACRSSGTILPDGRILKLRKYAPMGSALCFPVLALTVWAILSAAVRDTDTRESILVYGDDVIVPTAYAADAIERLESFGLKVNRDKSCTNGFFRESCGTDAFQGVIVTPVRLRTVWSSSPSPDVYSSWIAYANSMFDRRYFRVYDLIVERLRRTYGAIPDNGMVKGKSLVTSPGFAVSCPSLRYVSTDAIPKRSRWNKCLQRLEFHLWTIRSPRTIHHMDGWSQLLRYFAEAGTGVSRVNEETLSRERVVSYISEEDISWAIGLGESFSVCSYTDRNTSKLVKRWR